MPAARYRPKPVFDDSKRRGLAWERRDEENKFFRTMGELLNTMGLAFQTIKCQGGFGRPVTFLLTSMLLVMSVVAGLVIGILVVGFLIGYANRREGATLDGNQLAIALGMTLVSILVYSVMTLTIHIINAFIVAGFIHLALMIQSAAHRSYETTFRVLCYAWGTAFPLALIPVVGSFVLLFLAPFLTARGLMYTHQASAGQATLAALSPFLLVIGLMGLAFVGVAML
jgi:hypothetical protein